MMEESKLIKLEFLLDDLRAELGNRYLIAPQYLQDGYHIAIYSKKGDMIKQTIQPTLKEAINELKKG